MLVKVIETFKKLSGEVVKAGDVLEVSPEKVSGLIERGRVRLLPPSPASPEAPSCPDQGSGQATLPGEGENAENGKPAAFPAKNSLPSDGGALSMKAITPPLAPGDPVRWKSPLFGLLEAPLISHDFDSFTLIHPMTGEAVTLPNEWLVSLEERAAILEYDAGIPRGEADAQAKQEFFGLFRKGGKP